MSLKYLPKPIKTNYFRPGQSSIYNIKMPSYLDTVVRLQTRSSVFIEFRSCTIGTFYVRNFFFCWQRTTVVICGRHTAYQQNQYRRYHSVVITLARLNDDTDVCTVAVSVTLHKSDVDVRCSFELRFFSTASVRGVSDQSRRAAAV